MWHEEVFWDRLKTDSTPNIIDDVKVTAAKWDTSEEWLYLTQDIGLFVKYMLDTPEDEYDEEYAKNTLDSLMNRRVNLQHKKEIVGLAQAIMIQAPKEVAQVLITNLLVKLLWL